MRTQLALSPFRISLLVAAFLGLFCAFTEPYANAHILWNGANTNFSGSDTVSDVVVPGSLIISRGASQPIYNSVAETFASIDSPSNTQWAVVSSNLIGHLTDDIVDGLQTNFIPFSGDFPSVKSTAQGTGDFFSLNAYLLGTEQADQIPPPPPDPKTFIVRIIDQDIYFTLTFTEWTQHALSSGDFAYIRSTPSTVVPPPTPTISITSPAANSVFAAPAKVKVTVNANVSSGTITNVAVFSNSVALGSSQNGPFNITTTPLSAGSYPLTAVATAAGVSGTSAVVNISVVTPVNTALSSAAATNNQFSFKYTVNSGLRYDVESSTDLFHWTPLLTNIPGSSPATFSTNINGSKSFYRVGRLPNP